MKTSWGLRPGSLVLLREGGGEGREGDHEHADFKCDLILGGHRPAPGCPRVEFAC